MEGCKKVTFRMCTDTQKLKLRILSLLSVCVTSTFVAQVKNIYGQSTWNGIPKTRVRVLVELHVFTSIKVASSWRTPLQVAPVGVLT